MMQLLWILLHSGGFLKKLVLCEIFVQCLPSGLNHIVQHLFKLVLSFCRSILFVHSPVYGICCMSFSRCVVVYEECCRRGNSPRGLINYLPETQIPEPRGIAVPPSGSDCGPYFIKINSFWNMTASTDYNKEHNGTIVLREKWYIYPLFYCYISLSIVVGWNISRSISMYHYIY